MKNRLILWLLAVGLALAPAQAGTFTLTPIAPPVVGSPFDLALNLADPFSGLPADDAITSIGFNVNVLDPTVFGYGGFTAGPLFFDAGLPAPPDVLVFPNDPAGLGIASLGYTDPFVVAVLHFDALRIGTTTISVTTDAAGDLNQGIYYLSLEAAQDFSASGDFTVITPEPATFGVTVLAACIIGLALRRRFQ